jgi:uncharacterized protein (DUF1810 family)
MGAMDDPDDLQRFVDAQDFADICLEALYELRQGRKRSHWMWFVFPQVVELGRSSTAQRFAISGLPEAVAYLEHPVLGRRLRECAGVLTGLSETDPVQVFGPIDAQKLKSSMTLFSLAAPDEQVFHEVIVQYFAGVTDEATTSLVAQAP